VARVASRSHAGSRGVGIKRKPLAPTGVGRGVRALQFRKRVGEEFLKVLGADQRVLPGLHRGLERVRDLQPITAADALFLCISELEPVMSCTPKWPRCMQSTIAIRQRPTITNSRTNINEHQNTTKRGVPGLDARPITAVEVRPPWRRTGPLATPARAASRSRFVLDPAHETLVGGCVGVCVVMCGLRPPKSTGLE
jgi:hypothetical protein